MAKDLVEEDTSDLSDLDFEVAPSLDALVLKEISKNTWPHKRSLLLQVALAPELPNLTSSRRRVMSDPGSGKNKTEKNSSLLPEGLPSFEEVTRSMQVLIIQTASLVPIILCCRTWQREMMTLGQVRLWANRRSPNQQRCQRVRPQLYPSPLAHLVHRLLCLNLCAHRPRCLSLVHQLLVNQVFRSRLTLGLQKLNWCRWCN